MGEVKRPTWPPKSEWEAQLPREGDPNRLPAFVEAYRLHNDKLQEKQHAEANLGLYVQSEEDQPLRASLAESYQQLRERMIRNGVEV